MFCPTGSVLFQCIKSIIDIIGLFCQDGLWTLTPSRSINTQKTELCVHVPGQYPAILTSCQVNLPICATYQQSIQGIYQCQWVAEEVNLQHIDYVMSLKICKNRGYSLCCINVNSSRQLKTAQYYGIYCITCGLSTELEVMISIYEIIHIWTTVVGESEEWSSQLIF